MKIAIVLSVALHIVVLYTYPSIGLIDRESQVQDMSISYLGILSEKDFFDTKKREIPGELISSIPRLSQFGNRDGVWEASAVSVDVEWEFCPEPSIDEKEINCFLEDGSRKSLLDEIMGTHEKESPPLIEDLEKDEGN